MWMGRGDCDDTFTEGRSESRGLEDVMGEGGCVVSYHLISYHTIQYNAPSLHLSSFIPLHISPPPYLNLLSSKPALPYHHLALPTSLSQHSPPTHHILHRLSHTHIYTSSSSQTPPFPFLFISSNPKPPIPFPFLSFPFHSRRSDR